MNPVTTHYLNMFLGAGAILLQIFSLVILLLLFLGPKKNFLLDWVDKYFLWMSFKITLLASLFSLVYSEVAHFPPCQLCWLQRIFMFPLVFLFGVALWDRDRKVIKYTLPLLCFGFIVAIYQNLIYYFGAATGGPCDASGVSCFQHLISEFGGYISLPMLSLTSFFTLLTLTLVVHFYKKEVV